MASQAPEGPRPDGPRDTSDAAELSQSLRKALDSHGYGFQHAVARVVDEIGTPSPWRVAAVEFGVRSQGKDTRIDLVLESPRQRRLMVCECKRANPATSNWCFVRTPARGFTDSMTYTAMIRKTPHGTVLYEHSELLHSDDYYNISLPMRSNHKGDGGTGRSDGIEASVTQVLRGMNGLISGLSDSDELLPAGATVTVVPTIITTANLWACATHLGEASLHDGTIRKDSIGLSPRDWLWLDYPQSPGIQHDVPYRGALDSLSQVFRKLQLRRIAIVNSAGLRPFLTSQLWAA